MLILVGISLSFVIKEEGVIAKAKETAFRQEMSEVKEKVNLKKMELRSALEPSKIEEILEPVPYVDSTNWEDTLKAEVIYWGNNDTGINELNKKYVKKHFENLITKTSNGDIENLYYINSDIIEGKEKQYLYDAKTDTIFKIKSTKIWVYKVHSVKELDSLKGNSGKKEYEKIKDESQFVQVGDISYYEPDLKNFAIEGTNIIYYNAKDNTDTVTISAQEYLSKPRENRRTETKNNKTYEFYNYNEEEKIWANITVENNSLLTYWVWIPRYAYSIDGTTTSIIYITKDNKQADGTELPSGYIVHPAFENGKKGIWVSKYEPIATSSQHTGEFPYYIPDLTGFEKENTYAEVYNSSTESFTETKISNIKNLTEFAKNNNWFDYNNNIWANIKVVNPETNLETWWVWIPRYAYRTEGSSTITNIIFVDTEGNPLDGTELPSGYIVHPAFENGKKGIWVSKYEPVLTQTDVGMTNKVNPPNLKGYDVDNTYIECYDKAKNKFTEQTLRSILSSKSVIDGNNIVTKVDIDYSKIKGTWYDYSKRIWANIKVVNPETNLETWWVWIPRYAYNIYDQSTIEIIFLDANGNTLNGEPLPVTYIPHPAFNVEGTHEGIWASKYEPIETT